MADHATDPTSAARDFLAEDPDPATRAELGALLEAADGGDDAARAEIADRFSGPLEFGTAGLRGRVGAGLARMNRLVVIKATWGLGRHLLAGADEGGPDPRVRGVVVGFDARLSSRRFAEDAAAVLAGLGIPVQLFPDPVPTPLVSFAVPQLGAVMGIVVTASHNPPEDNGYKVYLETGAQIAPPVDRSIAAHIAAAPPLAAIARPAPADAAAARLRRVVDAPREIEDAYLDGLDRAALHSADATPLRIAYTALHGVGHRVVIRALTRAGFEGVASEPSQCDPDGTFRTVRFPNPEETGAMSRVLALAEETGAELVLANDPDADRLAAAVPDPAGGYRMLSGNEIGVLLAADAMDHSDTGGRRRVVITTVVSSSLLARIARAKDVACRQTLTGFKWIVKAALEAEEHGEAFIFGYEEALGYTVGPLVRDKDGIGAAVHLARLARFLKSQGRTLLDRIDELLMAHELVHPVQWSVVLPGLEGRERIRAAMRTLRTRPLERLGQSPVERFLDAAAGEETVNGTVRPIDLPRADLVTFQSVDGARLTARPSGTEPKIKFYLELVAQAHTRAEVATVRARLEEEGQALRRTLMDELGLGPGPPKPQ